MGLILQTLSKCFSFQRSFPMNYPCLTEHLVPLESGARPLWCYTNSCKPSLHDCAELWAHGNIPKCCIKLSSGSITLEKAQPNSFNPSALLIKFTKKKNHQPTTSQQATNLNPSPLPMFISFLLSPLEIITKAVSQHHHPLE